jgi:two-component system, NarL family, sensor histidine kinase NreB
MSNHVRQLDRTSAYIIHSQEEGMKRLANELHEGISQELYSVYTGLQTLQLQLGNEEALQAYVKELSDNLMKTLNEVRVLSGDLYPITLPEIGLVSSLKNYIKLYTSTFGIPIHLETEGEEGKLTEAKSLAMFRSCQESLINIAKYADVSEATIHLVWTDESLLIEIKDRGKGFCMEEVKRNQRMNGLAAMIHRMGIIGGQCDILSEEGEGSIIRLLLPFQR